MLDKSTKLTFFYFCQCSGILAMLERKGSSDHAYR